MLRSRTETRLIIIIINWLTKLRTKSTFCWMKEKIVIFSSKWLVGMGKSNNSFVIHHLSAWLFPRASARLAKSLVSFLRVAVYLVFISNMLTDGKAHQIQHNNDKEYSLDKGHHDGTWKRARSICGHANDWITHVTHQLLRDKRSSNVDSISWETHGRMLKTIKKGRF